jgi:hypothetical protein
VLFAEGESDGEIVLIRLGKRVSVAGGRREQERK